MNILGYFKGLGMTSLNTELTSLLLDARVGLSGSAARWTNSAFGVMFEVWIPSDVNKWGDKGYDTFSALLIYKAYQIINFDFQFLLNKIV